MNSWTRISTRCMLPLGVFLAILPSNSAVASEKAGILAGCKLLATVVMETCEVRQVTQCERKPQGTRSIDVYSKGKYKGNETYAAGLIMTEWRRGRFLQTLKIDDKEAIVPALAKLRLATPGTQITYHFTQIRRKLPAKTGQEAAGRAIIVHGGTSNFTVRDGPIPVLKFETEIIWDDGSRSHVTQLFRRGIRLTLGKTQVEFDAKGKQTSSWTDNVAFIFYEGNANFGLINPNILGDECQPGK